jgi:hypothetical protein
MGGPSLSHVTVMRRAALILVLFAVNGRTVAAQTASLTTIATPTTYQPPTASDRLKWFANSTAGPATLAGGLISAGWGTLFNSPREYGPHWDGFGKRYGMRLTGVATGNAIEAGLGAWWGEDPRYDRVPEQPFKTRVGHILKMTVLAKDRNGRNMPAYARYTAIGGNNLLSNAWRAPSEADAGHAAMRTGLGFVGRMSRDAFEEFWPDAKALVFRKKPAAGP